MDYKEQIEKEAEIEMIEYFGEIETQTRHTAKSFFISGVNSKISERIKVEFALEVLEELKQKSPFPNYVPHQYINNKITELKKQYKMKNVIQITDKILGVIVPSDAYDFEFIHNKTRVGYKIDHRLSYIDLPKGNFKIHGICTLPAFDFDFEVDEEWVEKKWLDKTESYVYLDYTSINKNQYFIMSTDSDNKEKSFRTRIQKAIQDEGMFVVNPYGENKPQELVDYTGRKDGIIANSLELEQWKSSESKTVKKLLIIEKN